jgi:hypothetical protein
MGLCQVDLIPPLVLLTLLFLPSPLRPCALRNDLLENAA